LSRITHIRNHDGELVPFRRARIVRAILAAVRQAGSSEEWIAEALTDTVVYFIDQRHGEAKDPPTAFDLDDIIENVLTAQADLARVARAFIDGRKQRAQLRELEESIAGTPGPEVSQPARGHDTWNRARIAAALVRENGLPPQTASEIAQAVEKKVQALTLPRLSTGLIRELVDVELLSRGLITDGRPGAIAVPRFDLESWLFPRDEAEPASGQQELSDRASKRVLAEYSLSSVHDARVREAHERGALHLEALDAPAALNEARFSAPALLTPGAGLGLQRRFPGSPLNLPAAFSRLALIVREASSITRHVVTLERLDRALAPLAAADSPQRARAAIQEGLGLLAWQGSARLRISLTPPAGDRGDFVSLALIDALCGEDSGLRSRVEIVLGVSAPALADEARRKLIERAASAASFCGQPAFRFREFAQRSERGLFGEFDEANAHQALLARAGLNLVKPALAVAQGDVSGFLALLDDGVGLAVEALAQRARFIERVAKRDLPQPVSIGARMLRALALASREVCLVPLGLQQAACLLSGANSAASHAAQRVAQQILSYLSFKAGELAARSGFVGVLGGRLAEDAGPRLHHEDRIQARENKRLPQDAQGYVAGAQCAEALGFEQRLAGEAALHELLRIDARLATGFGGARPTLGDVLAWLELCASGRGARPGELEISVATRICRDCGNISPAELAACPACGSQAWAVPAGQRFLFEQGGKGA